MTHLVWPAAVADVSVVETVVIQAIAWLKADARITALVGPRIYTNVPASAPFPLLVLQVVGDALPPQRFQGYDADIDLQLRATSAVAGPQEVNAIIDRVVQVLTVRDEPLPPFAGARWAREPSQGWYTEALAGQKLYHRPAIVRVRVEI